MRDGGCDFYQHGLQISSEGFDVDIGQIYDCERAQGKGVLRIGDGGDEVCRGILV